LKGRKIGVNPGTTAEVYMKLIFAKDNLSVPQDIEIVKLPPNLQLQALQSGQVDALVSYDPITTIAITQGIAKILVSHPFEELLDPFPSVGFTLSSNEIKRSPLVVQAVVNAISKAIVYGRAHPNEVNQSIIKYTNISAIVVQNMHLPQQVLEREIDRNQVQKVADLYYKNRLVSKKIDVNVFFYSSKNVKQ